jgi:large subunit ribosomal protein L19
MDQIRQLELENMKNSLPAFNVGDTVNVHYLIREGDKERIQIFSGTVIKIGGAGVRRSFLVRRLVAGEGVERSFPLHSPRVKDIEVKARGKARRARLFYLRDRVGKAVRLPANFGKNQGPSSQRGLPGTPVSAAPAETPSAESSETTAETTSED